MASEWLALVPDNVVVCKNSALNLSLSILCCVVLWLGVLSTLSPSLRADVKIFERSGLVEKFETQCALQCRSLNNRSNFADENF